MTNRNPQRDRFKRRDRAINPADPNDPTELAYALGYIRVSTTEQARQGMSLAAQLDDLETCIANNKRWISDSIYQDAMTGKRADRPFYAALMKRMRELRAEDKSVVLVVKWIDRLGRNWAEAARVWQECTELGVQIYSVMDGGFQLPMGYMILTAMASEQSRLLSEKITAVWTKAARDGWFKTGRYMSWGMTSRLATPDERLAGSPKNVLVLDTDTPEHVGTVEYAREVFARRAAGQSPRAITLWARSLPAEQRGGRNITVDTIKNMLRNPVYIRRFPDIDGRPWFDGPLGKWDALVSDEQWRAAQRPRRQMHAPTRYPLTGLVKCPRCGQNLSGSTQRGEWQARRYRCMAEARTGRATCNWSCDAAQVELDVRQQLRLLGRAFLELDKHDAERAWLKLHATKQHESLVEVQIRDLAKRRDQADVEIDSLTRKFGRDEIAKRAYDRSVRQAQQEREQADSELTRLQATFKPREEVTSWAEALKAVTDCSHEDVDPLARPALLNMLIQSITPRRVAWGAYDAPITWTTDGNALATMTKFQYCPPMHGSRAVVWGTKHCRVCGNDFEGRVGGRGQPDDGYCDNRCRNIAWRRGRRPAPDPNCPYCQAPINRDPHVRPRRYCASPECQLRARKDQRARHRTAPVDGSVTFKRITIPSLHAPVLS